MTNHVNTLVLIVSVVFISSIRYSYSNQIQDKKNYQKVLDQINEEMSENDLAASCPGAGLILTCGNGKCEPESGENEVTCPEDCLKAPVKSYNSETFCDKVQEVDHPETAEEVQSIVKRAVSVGAHIRVIGNAHTTNHQICSDGIIITTEKLRHIIGIEKYDGKDTVVVEPGATLDELTEWLHQRNQSLGYAIIGYRGVSIAGAIATGAHGSSPHHTAVLSSLVESITLVKADGTLAELSANNTDPDTFKALRANLGMLGAVVRIRLRIFPQFNLHVHVTYGQDKEMIRGNGVLSAIRNCDYGQIHWFPHAKKYVKTCGNKTYELPDKNANNTLLSPPIPSFIVKPFPLVLQYGACHQNLNILLEDLRYLSLKILPPFEKNNFFHNSTPSTNVIGPSHRMMSSLYNQDKQSMYVSDWEIAVPLSYAQDALVDLQQLFLQSGASFPLTGIFIRFAPAEDTTLMAHTSAGGEFHLHEPAVMIEFPYFRPLGFPRSLATDYLKSYKKMAKLLIEKYHGRAHFGKNQDWVFPLEIKLGNYEDHLRRFMNVVHNFDPHGVFSNDFSQILGDSPSKKRSH